MNLSLIKRHLALRHGDEWFWLVSGTTASTLIDDFHVGTESNDCVLHHAPRHSELQRHHIAANSSIYHDDSRLRLSELAFQLISLTDLMYTDGFASEIQNIWFWRNLVQTGVTCGVSVVVVVVAAAVSVV